MASYAMLTNVGRNKEAAALANGTALAISALAWGDGDRIPGGGETALESETGRKAVTRRGLTDGSPDTAFFEVLLAESEGPYVIREAGLFDDDGDMIAIARYDPAVNKPLDTVSAILRINVLFSDLENLVIQIDNATTYVPGEREITAGDGLTGGGDLSEDRTLAVTFATEAEALAGASSVKVMSPALVEAVVSQAIANLVNGAPGALDTLNEIATELAGNDSAISGILTSLASKLPGVDLATNGGTSIGVSDDGLSVIARPLAQTGSIIEYSGDIDDPALEGGFYRVTGAATGDKPTGAFNMIMFRRAGGDQLSQLMVSGQVMWRSYSGGWGDWRELAATDDLHEPPLGAGQTWQDMTASRADGVVYQNTTGRTIGVYTYRDNSNSSASAKVSADNITWHHIGAGSYGGESFIVPDGYYYKDDNAPTHWMELRA
ncbi:phage tail protein [Yoonia sp. I 8.24]|uniref:phage tail-collar fiber domain-containing protein n=1 Tax=Yoonia sp. I 8.24 TaxID=1537229 RepID=UPI001EDE1D00|nr:phage tail protein [Yoonia sp. I 8.24]MCG3266116.1 phage tail protein [Yoonia sp. I 8.24]